MTSLSRILAPAALLTSLVGLIAPHPAAAEPAGRAVASCRAEMLRHFPEGVVRTWRVAEIRASARQTQVSFFVTADRRYRFDCAANGDGQVVTAALDPRRDALLASGR